jgi:hypothetical protein
MNPEQRDWHWVRGLSPDEKPRPELWSRNVAGFFCWSSMGWREDTAARHWRYLRPCSPDDLSPAEVDARIAAAHKEWLAELNHDTDALMEAARDSALEEAARRLEELHKNHKYKPETGEGSEHDTGYYRAIAEGVTHIRVLSDTPSGMVLDQLAQQDLRAADCIKQWPECKSGAYDPRCCRFPKSCSCESGALKGEDNE